MWDSRGGSAGRLFGARKRLQNWILLDGNRAVVAGSLLALVFATLALLEAVKFIDVKRITLVVYIFSAMISGNLTLITVVLSINQLVLSGELGTIGDVDSRIENMRDYRRRVRGTTEQDTLSIAPAEFLKELFQNTRQRMEALDGMIIDEHNPQLRSEIDEIADTFETQSRQAIEQLEDSERGVFNALSATVKTNYGVPIHHIRRVRARWDGKLPAEVDDTLETLMDQIQQLDAARQYFKTVYIQQELSYLSRLLLYLGIPAEFLLIVVILVLASPFDPTSPIPIGLITVGITVSLAPLALLFAFVVRIAVIAEYTAATTPFAGPKEGH